MNNITIQNCILDGCADEQLCVYGGKTQDGGTPRECKDVLIKNNTLTNFGRRNASTADGILINNKVTNCTIEGNTITTGPNGFGSLLAFASNESTPGYIPTGVIVRYNKFIASKDNQWCLTIDGGQAQSITFYSNIFISTSPTATNCGNAWIFICTPNYNGAHFNFYNNVFYTKAGKNFQDDTSYGTGIVDFKNNIVYNGGTAGNGMVINSSGTTTHSNNLYYMVGSGDPEIGHDGGTYLYKSTVQKWESTSRNTDPLFTNLSSYDFTLLSGSPAIGAGTNLSLPADYAGICMEQSTQHGCL